MALSINWLPRGAPMAQSCHCSEGGNWLLEHYHDGTLPPIRSCHPSSRWPLFVTNPKTQTRDKPCHMIVSIPKIAPTALVQRVWRQTMILPSRHLQSHFVKVATQGHRLSSAFARRRQLNGHSTACCEAVRAIRAKAM